MSDRLPLGQFTLDELVEVDIFGAILDDVLEHRRGRR